MGVRIKVAIASGSDNLIPILLQKMAEIQPDLPLFVVSEFAPSIAGVRWIRWFPGKKSADNAARLDAALAGCDVVLAAVILQPRLPYWTMRLAAFRRWPLRLMIFNENLDHFMLRPRSIPAIGRHFSWRTKNFLRWQMQPGGKLYTFIWRIFHPGAFRRPLALALAKYSWAVASGWRSPGCEIRATAEFPPGISVVIPSRNGRDLLDRLFHSMAEQWPDEVIVVDNGSDDGTAEWLRNSHPGIIIEPSPEPLSFADAVNRGINKAKYARICLLNNDMVLEPCFFQALEAPFHSVPHLFAATAQIFFPAGARREETGKAMYHAPSSQTDPGQFPLWCELPLEGEDQTWVLYGSGGCTLYDAAKLRALGGFGPQFTPAYVEDLDIGWRAWQQGWPTVYAANARLLHLHRSTTSKYYSSIELECALERNYVRFAAGSGSGRLWRESLHRLNFLASKMTPEKSAEAALFSAWRQPWRQPRAAAKLGDTPLALCGGGVAVFPGRAAADKPRILIAAPYPPFPLSHGGAVRMFNLMREAARDFDQILIVFCDQLAPPAPELLEICCEIVLVRREGTHLLPTSARPDVVEEHDTPEFRAALSATISKWKPDIVQLEFTQMALYAEACRPAKTVLVEHDITLDLYAQLLATQNDYDTREQHEKWVRFEHSAWQSVDAVITMSEKDRAAVGLPTAVAISNGVDLERFTPGDDEPDPTRLLFIGSFAHLPNLMALDFFLKEVWPRLAGMTLHVIAGQRHEYFLERYADRIRPDLTAPGLELDGFVRDVRPAYRRAAIVIAPLIASAGTNIKILEAMAMGKAIVSTAAGINGLDLHPGQDVLVTGTAEEMAKAIARLVADPDRRKQLENHARRTAVEEFGWDRIAERQAALYRSLLKSETIH